MFWLVPAHEENTFADEKAPRSCKKPIAGMSAPMKKDMYISFHPSPGTDLYDLARIAAE